VVFSGEDFPACVSAFRRFNFWMLGNYRIRTSVFPGAHAEVAARITADAQLAAPESLASDDCPNGQRNGVIYLRATS
jgi:hypothetical protein